VIYSAAPVFTVTGLWKSTCSDTHAGILIMRGVENPSTHPELENRMKDLDAQRHTQYAGQD
jgi:hypothetical protein